jgi:hypothetical protein
MELRKHLGLAAHRADLVVHVADLAERPLLPDDLLGERHAGRREIAVDDLVDQAVLQGIVGGDRIAADDHRERLLDADDARQALGPAGARQQPELDLR